MRNLEEGSANELSSVENVDIGQTFSDALADRRLFRLHGNTETIGFCYPFSKVNDTVVVLYGCNYTVLLRSIDDELEQYAVVGEVYVHGYMKGEAIGQFEEQYFVIQ